MVTIANAKASLTYGSNVKQQATLGWLFGQPSMLSGFLNSRRKVKVCSNVFPSPFFSTLG